MADTADAHHPSPLLLPEPPTITRFSELSAPSERLPWWAPAGWLLVALSSVVLYALVLALSPLILACIGIRRLWAHRLRYRRDPSTLRIAIVGAGWSGLQALERFRELGVTDVDVYERYDEIGGTWSPNLRYHGLQIHGSMTVTSFDGFPYSDDPDVQRGKALGAEVDRYIRSFADARGLLPRVRLHSRVDAVSYRSADRTGTLTVTDTHTGEVSTSDPYDLVIWASMAAYPAMPQLPGSDRFAGRQLHTTRFTTDELASIVHEKRRVIVVGGGKAACDVVLGLTRAGYRDFEWVMRKPYLFYRFEVLLHDASPMDRIRGLSYLATVIWTGISRRFGAILHWSSGYVHSIGAPHADFTHFHGGTLDADQRTALRDIPFTIGNPVSFDERGLLLRDGGRIDGDVVIWATGNTSGIDTLSLEKDGEPFELARTAKLYNHFIVPGLPVLASSTALWTTFGPMRATNTADLAVHHLCVRAERSEVRMQRSADRQLSSNSVVHSFLWAKGACWLQQWVFFHIDLVLQGITPVESFLRHAIEVFVLAKETPLAFNILPPQRVPLDDVAPTPRAEGTLAV
jgi:cation diffusion facilitator CzcD-associated flavoprotein CzcO